MRKFYLVTTDHLEDGLWFREESDFAVGMNYVAIQAVLSPLILILAFILMSNHLHFVLYGTYEEVRAFIDALKGRYGQYFFRKYGVRELLRRNEVDIREISAEDPEALERAVAYVQMNCVAAGVCSHPSQYPWGTGSVYFPGDRSTGRGVEVGSMSRRALSRTLHSDFVDLPGKWLMSPAGFILPESYVGGSTVERIFRTPGRLNYFLNTSSKARKRLETGEDRVPAFKDQVISHALPDLCQSLFQKAGFKDLSASEQAETLRQLRYRFSSNVNQVARVCGLSYAEAAKMLDGV